MKREKLHYWLWFGLILTTIPIIFTYWKLRGVRHTEPSYCTLVSVLSNGELLLVCLALLGANLGDLFRDQAINKNAGFTLLAMTFVLCLFAIFSYGEINTNDEIDSIYAFNTSIVTFVCSSVVCLVSILTPRR
jgi:uncharacterized membrane protein